MPKRIQLSRKRGWRKPDGCIVVSRPSRWGNPFRIGDVIGDRHLITRAEAVALYKDGIMNGSARFRNDIRRALAEHDLACWCPLGQPCHADVLLEIANSQMEVESEAQG